MYPAIVCLKRRESYNDPSDSVTLKEHFLPISHPEFTIATNYVKRRVLKSFKYFLILLPFRIILNPIEYLPFEKYYNDDYDLK